MAVGAIRKNLLILPSEVSVFEVNSLGFIDSHIGNFDLTGSLIIELRDRNTNALLQHRIMSWSNDSLRMKAVFVSNQDTIEHELTMIRQKN